MTMILPCIEEGKDAHSEGMMKLPINKAKIVCTIGPASESPAVMKQMIEAGQGRVNVTIQ